MRVTIMYCIVAVLMCPIFSGAVAAELAEDNWPSWRGPHDDGSSPHGNPPITWSETENIKWKVSMPDAGDCTPVIWGDKIFIQTAVPSKVDPAMISPLEANILRPEKQKLMTKISTEPIDFNLMCLDRATGEVLWEKTAATAFPHEGHHPSSSLASYSPVTDGEFVWVSFGTQGIYCYDLEGNLQWSAELERMFMVNGFGEGSSPAIAGDAVIVVRDHEGASKIFAFNKKTGDLLWQRDRDEGSSWATPIPVEVDGSHQVIVSASNFVRSYDAENGDIIWQCGGLKAGAIPSPVIGFGKVFCMTGYVKYSLLAIDLGRKGDLTDTDAIAWRIDENTPYVPSPLLYGGKLYFTESLKPSLSVYDAESGTPIYTSQRLPGMKQLYGSPTGAAGRVYISDRKGTTLVLKDGDTFEVIATNHLDDGFDASPVIVGNELFLKGENFLYCIAEK